MNHLNISLTSEELKQVKIERISNIEYDVLLSKSLIVIQFWNTNVNNCILECIMRGTPIICNKIPSIVEILGEQYKLYAENEDNIIDIIQNIENKNINLVDISNYLFSLSKNFEISNFKKIIYEEISKIKS